MLVLVGYDINTSDDAGVKRLHKISKICESYGQRVQDSLFEMYIDWDKYLLMKQKLEDKIDKEKDTIRIYVLGNKYEGKVIYLGKDKLIKVDKSAPVII